MSASFHVMLMCQTGFGTGWLGFVRLDVLVLLAASSVIGTAGTIRAGWSQEGLGNIEPGS